MVEEERGRVGLSTKVDMLMELLEPKRKRGKKLRLPKVKKAKLRQNYALVIYVMDNLSINIEYIKIENEYIYIKKTNSYHLATSKYVMNYKGIPTIVQPTWRLEPFCPSSDYQQTIDKHAGSEPQKVIIALMEKANLKIKGKVGGKAIIWILIAVVAGLYLLSKIMGKG